MATELARKEEGGLLGLLEKSQQAISAALPKHITPERMMRVARTAIQTTPALRECTPMSVIGSIVEAAQLGLEPNGVLGEAYLVPFYNNKTKRKECQLIPGYRGYIGLARRSGEVQSISAEVVYSKDHFDFEYGLDEKLVHRPHLGEDRGKPVAVYAVCRFKDEGGHHFVVMGLDEVEKIRAGSKAGDSGPWNTHWAEMAKKTAIRRLMKYLPLSVELQRATMIDEYAEAGYRPDSGQIIDLTPLRTEDLRQRLAQSAHGEDEPETTAVDAETGEVIEDPREEEPEAEDEPEPDTNPVFEKARKRLIFKGKPGNFQRAFEALQTEALEHMHEGEWLSIVITELDALKLEGIQDLPAELRKDFVQKLKDKTGIYGSEEDQEGDEG